MRLVVMGVSGVGKSTVGAALAQRLGAAFVEGDDLHPAANVAKMSAGQALDDSDRAPWLDAVAAALAAADDVVVTCSALRRSYRDRLRASAPDAFFVHVETPPAVVQARLGARTGHFMPASLLTSQLGTLEPLGADEAGVVVDGSGPVAEVVEAVVRQLPGLT